jgi:hypothetical protein
VTGPSRDFVTLPEMHLPRLQYLHVHPCGNGDARYQLNLTSVPRLQSLVVGAPSGPNIYLLSIVGKGLSAKWTSYVVSGSEIHIRLTSPFACWKSRCACPAISGGCNAAVGQQRGLAT